MKFSFLEFTYNKKEKTLVAEASDLGLRFSPSTLEITGKKETRRFTLDRIVKDSEGEILWHEYKGTENLTLKIFND